MHADKQSKNKNTCSMIEEVKETEEELIANDFMRDNDMNPDHTINERISIHREESPKIQEVKVTVQKTFVSFAPRKIKDRSLENMRKYLLSIRRMYGPRIATLQEMKLWQFQSKTQEESEQRFPELLREFLQMQQIKDLNYLIEKIQYPHRIPSPALQMFLEFCHILTLFQTQSFLTVSQNFQQEESDQFFQSCRHYHHLMMLQEKESSAFQPNHISPILESRPYQDTEITRQDIAGQGYYLQLAQSGDEEISNHPLLLDQ